MARQQISLKQIAIDKNNTAIVAAVAVASFLVIFSLIASFALVKQMSYQQKVIGKKKTALKQLKQNAEEVDKLKVAYQAFANSPQNVIGGSSTGKGDRDGENPRLILDALPSKYDFPALTTSLEKVFKPYGIESITGIDDEANQSDEAAITPQVVEMPFSVTINSSAGNSKQALQIFERSIRPFQVIKVNISGEANQLDMTVDGTTYFQPKKKFDVSMEKVQ